MTSPVVASRLIVPAPGAGGVRPVGAGRTGDRAGARDVVGLDGVLGVGVGLRNLVVDEERDDGRDVGLGVADRGHGDDGGVFLAVDGDGQGLRLRGVIAGLAVERDGVGDALVAIEEVEGAAVVGDLAGCRVEADRAGAGAGGVAPLVPDEPVIEPELAT